MPLESYHHSSETFCIDKQSISINLIHDTYRKYLRVAKIWIFYRLSSGISVAPFRLVLERTVPLTIIESDETTVAIKGTHVCDAKIFIFPLLRLRVKLGSRKFEVVKFTRYCYKRVAFKYILRMVFICGEIWFSRERSKLMTSIHRCFKNGDIKHIFHCLQSNGQTK